MPSRVSFDSREEDWWTAYDTPEIYGDIVVTNEFVDDLRIYV